MLIVPFIEFTIGSDVSEKIGTRPEFGATSKKASVASGRSRCKTEVSASSPST